MGLLRKLLGFEGATVESRRSSGRDGAQRPLGERSVRNGRFASSAAGPSQPQVGESARPLPARPQSHNRMHDAMGGSGADQAMPAGKPACPAALAEAAASQPRAATPDVASPAASAPPAAPAAAEVRSSSLPQPLAQGGQQQAAAGSGPGAPVSPHPAEPPALHRVSSTPCPPALSQCSMSTQHSSNVDESTAAGGSLELDGRSSKEGSGRSGRSGGVSAASAAVAGGSAERQPRPQQQQQVQQCQERRSHRRTPSPPPAMRWHPAMGPLPKATPAWARKPRSRSRDGAATQPAGKAAGCGASAAAAGGAAPVLLTTSVPPPPPQHLSSVSPTSLPAGSPESPQGPAPGSSVGAVSLLTSQLRGPSAASSAGPSRESSVRNGVKRQPGGLTLALSRENSIRGGAGREGSHRGEREPERERSVREGSQRGQNLRDGSNRSASLRGGAGRRDGSVLSQWGASSAFGMVAAKPPAAAAAGEEAGQHLLLQQPLGRVSAAVGCGSGDWMGLPPVSEALASSSARSQGYQDPFTGLHASEVPVVGSFSDPDTEPEMAPPPPSCKPMQPVGSWGSRVTKFSQDDSERAAGATQQASGLDPVLLSAALEALAGHPVSSRPGSGAGPAPGVLVGDPELPLAGLGLGGGSGNADVGPYRLDRRSSPWQSVPARSGAGSSGGAQTAASAGAAMLCSSWGGEKVLPLPLLAQLGGSAPIHCFTPPSNTLAPMHRPHKLDRALHPAAADITAADREWNRSFMKRWREVKKRAYLQALGLRALWRVHSVSDRHEPLELLTNDLPQYDNGMRRAWSATRLTGQREELRRGTASALQPAGMRRLASSAGLHKDPSLSTLLLGEVAEVC